MQLRLAHSLIHSPSPLWLCHLVDLHKNIALTHWTILPTLQDGFKWITKTFKTKYLLWSQGDSYRSALGNFHGNGMFTALSTVKFAHFPSWAAVVPIVIFHCPTIPCVCVWVSERVLDVTAVHGSARGSLHPVTLSCDCCYWFAHIRAHTRTHTHTLRAHTRAIYKWRFSTCHWKTTVPSRVVVAVAVPVAKRIRKLCARCYGIKI